MPVDGFALRAAAGARELRTELTLRREVVLAARDRDRAICRGVVRRECGASRVGASGGQVELGVLVGVLPGDDPHALVLGGRVDRHRHRAARRDRLVDELGARSHRCPVECREEDRACPDAIGLLVLILVAEAIGTVRVSDDVARVQRGERQRTGERGLHRVGVLAVPRYCRGGLVVFVPCEVRREPERRDARPRDGDVLVVALRVDPLAGGPNHEVTVEAVGPLGLPGRHLDAVGER